MDTSPASTLSGPRIELLGVPRLLLPGSKPHVLERRDAALLAWLAIHGPTPRARMIVLLWPDLPTRTAQSNLRQRLFRLKQRAGDELVVSDPVMALACGVRHDLETVAPDHSAAPGLAGSNDEAALLGELDYDDCGELGEWVAKSRERFHGERRKQLAQHAAQLEAEGRIAEAIAFAERLTAEAPTAEHAHRRLMRLHYRRGDRAAALAAFERCHEVLGRVLGARPGAETRDLAALIERSGALPPPLAAPPPVAALRPPRLIGRDAEWRAIEAAWSRREPVLILGEPGIGKSRLAADFAVAQDHAPVYRAHLGDARMPYSLLARLLRGLIERFGRVPQEWAVSELSRLLPELGPRPIGKLEPVPMRQAVAAAMAHWRTHGLSALVIDDLHWADDASLEWLLDWVASGEHPQLVMTVRTNEIPEAMRHWRQADDARALPEVNLTALSVEAIAELLDSLGLSGLDGTTWAEPLARRTGGNPMFILELLKAHAANPAAPTALLDGVVTAPPHIGKMLERRLEQLRPEALRLARVAALAGVDFSAVLAAQVLGCHVLDLSEPWAELERAQVILEGAFAHDLILDATLRSVPTAIALALHGAIASSLATRADAVAARIAHHWHAGREWALAAPQFEHAARAASSASRPGEELAMWDLAVACHEHASAPGAAFQARCRAIEPAIVSETYERVQLRIDGLLKESRSDAERLLALIAQAQHLGTTARCAAALPFTREALALARQLGDRKREFMALNLHGQMLSMTGQAGQGLPLFEAMAGSVGETGDAAIEHNFAGSYAYALHASGRLRESVAWYQRAADMAQTLGDTNQYAIQMGNLALNLGGLGQNEAALDAALQAQAAQARLGELKGIPYVVSLLNVGVLCMIAGRFAEGFASFDGAYRVASEGHVERLLASVENHLATAYLRLGQPARARQALRPVAASAPASTRARRVVVEWRVASFSAPADLAALLRAREDFGPDFSVVESQSFELALAGAESAQDGLLRSRRVRALALADGQNSFALTALAIEADAQRRLGLLEDAAASARQAVHDVTESGHHDLFAPHFWWVCFQALDGAGCEAEALDALRRGAEWVERSLAHVPEPFRESYLHRSAIVPSLMAAAKHRLARTPPRADGTPA